MRTPSLFSAPSSDVRTRYQNFENPTGAKGRGGMENHGRKGHAFDDLKAGETKTLFQAEGSGVITHIWITVNSSAGGVLNPSILRGVRIDAYWDGATTPAISAPLGDFFGIGLGRSNVPFECELFSSPSAKAFNSYVPMPYLRSARLTITNETGVDITHVFYTITYQEQPLDPEETLYLHATWRREQATVLGRDFLILPRVTGRGRYLGANLSVVPSPRYPKVKWGESWGNAWWGEGEVKIHLDGDLDRDGKFATLVGTGAEDYPGTAWGMGAFNHRYQGILVSRDEGYAFYRHHIPDAIYFHEDVQVSMQQIGGALKRQLLEMEKTVGPIRIVSVNTAAPPRRFIQALTRGMELADPVIQPEDWCNFEREGDDWAACAYFYLDRPENGLPPLQPAATRLAGVVTGEGAKRQDG
ncbi:MAG: DUF2961 domain-containing protein [Planctomycetota bacterium]|nr:DUF2961 domain-containing protein [Planctomycetota bacterium]